MSGRGELSVHVWGDFACFTRPEYTAERVSYPVITPPAAVGVLSSIFWRPEFDWLVRRIWICRPPRWVSMMRNEVKVRASRALPQIDVTQHRTQRHTLFLRDVEYVIFAEPQLRPHAEADVAKYRDQFRRRVERGAFFSPPYLGLREHPASFGALDLAATAPLADLDIAVGPMNLDLGYGEHGTTTPEFWDAHVTGGVLDVPIPSRFARR